MKLNGCTISLSTTETLYGFLIAQNFDVNIIAVELNGEIVPRATYKEVMVKDEDTIEVVRFVGGG